MLLLMQLLIWLAINYNSAGIEVSRRQNDQLPPVVASWEHMKSVWLNLILNARDALQDKPGDQTN